MRDECVRVVGGGRKEMAKCIVLILSGAATAWKGKRYVQVFLDFSFSTLLRSAEKEAFFKKESPGRGDR